MGKRKRTKDEKQKANSGAGTDARDIQSTLRTFSNIGAGRGPETSLGAVLSNGVALHQAGRLDEAEAHYRKVLSRSPHHVDALALLGAICLQRRRFDAGLRLINHSLRINSLQPMAFNNRAYALKELGRLQAARAL